MRIAMEMNEERIKMLRQLSASIELVLQLSEAVRRKPEELLGLGVAIQRMNYVHQAFKRMFPEVTV